ncbi:Xaa-Pro dipeptidyl-peptidase [Virgisporangium aurantiacum]|uniref:X-Pro dipeptidyl-peptidase n=1 Tax=Virgisporangium aurantiacum TaxID=175570 RepID=A0A8J3Z586_9ACTN|nr:Xaa-Pro dipeptidyl-peptidase [Virgisporangium aurantiacum]GIJ55530.1 X-Pro dipeptidyl-peptidase [Virgisporangium aurantiacum]
MSALVGVTAGFSFVPQPGSAAPPRYSYADAVRESVQVQTPLDNDADGQPDRVTVDIVRPREAAARGIRVPVVMVASPYYQCCGRGLENERKEYAADGTVTKFPLFYDNYFVPRGYAFAAVDAAGTSRSTGCADVGGREEILAVKAAIDWLNGRAAGFHADGTGATAGWSTGRVGMIGKSWDGSIANGVAATGVPGLATIVPISAISSWYDYSRFGGVVRSRRHHVFLHNLITGRPAAACAPVVAGITAGTDDATGNRNAYWDERDFRPDAGRVRASVLIAHGLNDTNVTTTQFGAWWTALARQRVPRKIWLYQQAHTDPFDVRRAEWVRTLDRWFEYWLKGVNNGIMREPQATIERAPGQWVDEPTWPAPSLPVPLRLGEGTLGLRPVAGTLSFTDNPTLRERELVADPGTPVGGRLTFLSAPVPASLRVSGTASVTLRVSVDRPTTNLTVRLVDYGTANRVNYANSSGGIVRQTTESCWGESTAADDACYFDTVEDVVATDHAVLTRGWLEASHFGSLSSPTPLEPGTWYTMTVRFQPHDFVLATGHVLGLVVSQSDRDYTSATSSGATVQVDLAGSRLTLPFAGPVRLDSPDRAPAVTTAPAPDPPAIEVIP